MLRILCIEDDFTTARYIAEGLGDAGFSVEIAIDGPSGLALASAGRYDALVLDRMLPGMDGLELLKTLRERGSTTPIVMLSALASLDERVRGLRAGSDDYLGKPFALDELAARLEAVCRRSAAVDAGNPPVTRLACGDLEVDLLARSVTCDGRRIELQPREFSLLEFLMRHQGQTVTRTMLLENVWDYHFDPGTNVIDVHVSRMRRKLGDGGARTQVHTIRGTGYRIGER